MTAHPERKTPARPTRSHVAEDDTDLFSHVLRQARGRAGDYLKWLTAGGTVLYALTFAAYHQYFQQLGLSPEEVGVTNSFLLVRSFGFILLMFCVAAATWLMRVTSLQLKVDTFWQKVRLIIVQLALTSCLIAFVRQVAPPSWPSPVSFTVAFSPILIGGLSAILAQSHRAASLVIMLILGTALTVVFPALALTMQGAAMGRAAMAGERVRPYRAFGTTLIDVSAEPVTVHWIGPPLARPTLFGEPGAGLNGILLGRSSGSVAVLVQQRSSRTVITMPTSTVVLETG